jgi:hypothetical protein
VGELVLLEWDAVAGAIPCNICQSGDPCAADWGITLCNTTDTWFSAPPNEYRQF